MKYDKDRFKTPGKYVEYLQMLAQDVISYNTPVSADDGSSESELCDFIEDTGPTIEELAENIDRRDVLLKFINTLPPRESLVLKMRYGFHTGSQMTLEDIGDNFGVTRERIRQIEAKALRRLRHKLITKGIRKGDL